MGGTDGGGARPWTTALRESGWPRHFTKDCLRRDRDGRPTGFRFAKGSYGPFAAEVKLALHELANRNWLREEQLGEMTAIRVGPQYERDREKFMDVIDRHVKKIDKVVDLFSRIKSTDQAEEVITVLFASRELKKVEPGKKSPSRTFTITFSTGKRAGDRTKNGVKSQRDPSLDMLGWMRLRFSESLLEAAA